MAFFRYGQVELDHIRERDKPLGSAIDRIGMVERSVIPDMFAALVHAIVGQQVSAKASATIWGRMQERFGEISPPIIAAATVNEIQQCGLSTRKAGYIKEIGENVDQGWLNLPELSELPDVDVINVLSSMRGIGIWTAEMLLISSLQRPDVVSWGDLAIRRGMMRLYGFEALTREQFDECKERYSPYGSVASIYLWRLSIE